MTLALKLLLKFAAFPDFVPALVEHLPSDSIKRLTTGAKRRKSTAHSLAVQLVTAFASHDEHTYTFVCQMGLLDVPQTKEETTECSSSLGPGFEEDYFSDEEQEEEEQEEVCPCPCPLCPHFRFVPAPWDALEGA